MEAAALDYCQAALDCNASVSSSGQIFSRKLANQVDIS